MTGWCSPQSSFHPVTYAQHGGDRIQDGAFVRLTCHHSSGTAPRLRVILCQEWTCELEQCRQATSGGHRWQTVAGGGRMDVRPFWLVSISISVQYSNLKKKQNEPCKEFTGRAEGIRIPERAKYVLTSEPSNSWALGIVRDMIRALAEMP